MTSACLNREFTSVFHGRVSRMITVILCLRVEGHCSKDGVSPFWLFYMDDRTLCIFCGQNRYLCMRVIYMFIHGIDLLDSNKKRVRYNFFHCTYL